MRSPEQSVRGVLTDDQAERLKDSTTTGPESAEFLEQLSKQLWDTFSDIQLLYTHLSDEELRTVFAGTDEEDRAIVLSHTAMTFLYLGLELMDDDGAYRMENAIKDAEASVGREATVHIDVTSQPFPPIGELRERLESTTAGLVPERVLTHLLYDETVPARDLAEVFGSMDSEDISADDVEEERKEIPAIERIPPSVVTNVEVVSTSPTEVEDR